jgi:hypothetical protein
MSEQTPELEKYRYKNYEAFHIALTKAPPAAFLKSRSIGGNRESNYQSIQAIEALAEMMFREWNVVEEKYMNVLNEIVCTVKVQALPDYPGADYMTFTGSASKAVQVNAGTKSTPKAQVHQFPLGKKENALQYCLPAVRSEAIGCAFETKGNVFGRNVNREASNDFGFDVSYEKTT